MAHVLAELAQIVQGAGLLDMQPAARLHASFSGELMGQPVTLPLAGGKSLYRPNVGNSIDDFSPGSTTVASSAGSPMSCTRAAAGATARANTAS